MDETSGTLQFEDPSPPKLDRHSKIIENQPSLVSGYGEAATKQEPVFTLFPSLPTEIRLQIWRSSLTPRIIRWVRKTGVNVFTAPARPSPLFEISRESRETAFLYGLYTKLPSSNVWFSPLVDFLFFDPAWIGLAGPPNWATPSDPLDSLLPELENVRNIMVHPNYTDDRKKPSAMFEKFSKLDQILVAADERSIGTQNKFMLSTVYDIKLYYAAIVRKRIPDVRIPYIAVGCLGWTGQERRKMHHGDGDNRQLVAVCDNQAQMMAHANSVREEEWKFIQERRAQPRNSLLRRKDGKKAQEPAARVNKTYPTTPDLPSYEEAVLPKEQPVSNGNPSFKHGRSMSKRWDRVKEWGRKLLRV